MCFPNSSINGLTSRVFFMTHLKLDASIKLSGDQSIGHDHHHPWNHEQYKQKQNIPVKKKIIKKMVWQYTYTLYFMCNILESLVRLTNRTKRSIFSTTALCTNRLNSPHSLFHVPNKKHTESPSVLFICPNVSTKTLMRRHIEWGLLKTGSRSKHGSEWDVSVWLVLWKVLTHTHTGTP